MDYIKVKDKDYLLRDTHSNGIINSDFEGYEKYAENYKKAYHNSQKIKNLEDDVNEIKSSLDEIKKLLRNLANES